MQSALSPCRAAPAGAHVPARSSTQKGRTPQCLHRTRTMRHLSSRHQTHMTQPRARAPIPIIRRRTTPVNRLAPDRHLARSGSRNEACLRRCLNNWQSWQTALPKLQLNNSARRRQKSSWTLTRVADCGSRHFPRNAFVRMSALGQKRTLVRGIRDVRFTPRSGHAHRRHQCLLCANCGRATAHIISGSRVLSVNRYPTKDDTTALEQLVCHLIRESKTANALRGPHQ